VRKFLKPLERVTVDHDRLEKHDKGSDPEASLAVEGSIDDEFFLGFAVHCQSKDLVLLAFAMPIATGSDHRVSFSAAYYTGTEHGLTEST
jgi:hypothetical protein